MNGDLLSKQAFRNLNWPIEKLDAATQDELIAIWSSSCLSRLFPALLQCSMYLLFGHYWWSAETMCASNQCCSGFSSSVPTTDGHHHPDINSLSLFLVSRRSSSSSPLSRLLSILSVVDRKSGFSLSVADHRSAPRLSPLLSPLCDDCHQRMLRHRQKHFGSGYQ